MGIIKPCLTTYVGSPNSMNNPSFLFLPLSKTMMKLRSSLHLGILFQLHLFPGLQAVHFSWGQVPATITAFQPQTVTWVRDDRETEPLSLEFRVAFGYSQVAMTTTVDEKQHEGQITYMVTTTGPFTVQGFIGATPVGNSGPIVSYNPINPATQVAVLPTGLTTTSSAPPYLVATDSGSNRSRAIIIGGSVGGGVFLVVLVIVFLILRRRRDRRRRDLDKAVAVLDPFSPRTLDSAGASRKQKRASYTPPSERKVVEGSSHQAIEWNTQSEQFIGPQQPDTARDNVGVGTFREDDDGPVDQASYRTMQAQIRLLMQRMERMEAVEQAPPEYVSAYGSNR
ncbi:hypothetical protein PM082_014895 [Marasmius tenuissimus]|nr:hypothetical protein PM082_014895 [Marasmius tenuissimus]